MWEIDRDGQLLSVQAPGGFIANRGELVRQTAPSGCGICQLSDVLVGPDLGSGGWLRCSQNRSSGSPTICARFTPRKRHIPRKAANLVHFLLAAFTLSPPWQI